MKIDIFMYAVTAKSASTKYKSQPRGMWSEAENSYTSKTARQGEEWEAFECSLFQSHI